MTKSSDEEQKNLRVKAGLKTKTIQVDYLARVEGEGALSITVKGGEVTDVKLKIFEPPRFFEAFLRGRHYSEAPDITARICGICPVAYQMSSVLAMENALRIVVPESISQLRQLLYCGEWIESHMLHLAMLHLPDFLGYPDAIQLAKIHPQIIQDALQIKKAGNHIVTVLGGREIHPINVRVGGFYALPKIERVTELREMLLVARDKLIPLLSWCNRLEFPALEQDYHFVTSVNDKSYPMLGVRLRSNQGLDIAVCEYDQYFEENHASYTHALQSTTKDGKPYFLGPMSRINLARERLADPVQALLKDLHFEHQCKNPFRSLLCRGFEIYHALETAIEIIENIEKDAPVYVPHEVHAGTGYGCSEAPRGTLYHRYTIDDEGIIQDANIIPPTSQNQLMIEADLRRFVTENIHLPKDKLTWRCEQAIRNYDPCISCATHFLKVEFLA